MAACLTAEKHGEDFIEDIYFPQVVFFLDYLQEILVITESRGFNFTVPNFHVIYKPDKRTRPEVRNFCVEYR